MAQIAPAAAAAEADGKSFLLVKGSQGELVSGEQATLPPLAALDHARSSAFLPWRLLLNLFLVPFQPDDRALASYCTRSPRGTRLDNGKGPLGLALIEYRDPQPPVRIMATWAQVVFHAVLLHAKSSFRRR